MIRRKIAALFEKEIRAIAREVVWEEFSRQERQKLERVESDAILREAKRRGWDDTPTNCTHAMLMDWYMNKQRNQLWVNQPSTGETK